MGTRIVFVEHEDHEVDLTSFCVTSESSRYQSFTDVAKSHLFLSFGFCCVISFAEFHSAHCTSLSVQLVDETKFHLHLHLLDFTFSR